jgi:U32 family peptidase
LLRDEGQNPDAKKSALGLLEQSLGRPGTHYHFLPQRPQNPIDTQIDSGSGLLIGSVRGGRDKPYIEPRQHLLEGDKLRLGYEDDEWHQTIDVKKSLPKGGKFFVKISRWPAAGKSIPAFLIDRRESYLSDEIAKYEKQIEPVKAYPEEESTFNLRLSPGSPRQPQARRMHVQRHPGSRMRQTTPGLWLSAEAASRAKPAMMARIWWWLPPVIWPEEEEIWLQLIKQVLSRGAQQFVVNAPWQTALFHRPDRLSLWAGPFCNISNPLAIRSFKLLGGQGVIVSPELGRADLESLPAKSVLPLGIVISGHWPFCVSRVLSPDLKPGQPFVSPRGEEGWVQRHGCLYWVYPNWTIDLNDTQDALIKAGYRLFVHMDEYVPKSVQLKKRPGHWNWEVGLK